MSTKRFRAQKKANKAKEAEKQIDAALKKEEKKKEKRKREEESGLDPPLTKTQARNKRRRLKEKAAKAAEEKEKEGKEKPAEDVLAAKPLKYVAPGRLGGKWDEKKKKIVVD
ncbi:hypothetical protein N0V90_007189 [Kalmusia sp. IMI 367209]|nr:hypothetical protein N0V90_007189 [Kalmusia sp. IMI 367209]